MFFHLKNLISENNNPWFCILLHTQSIVCATIECLEYLGYITLNMGKHISSKCGDILKILNWASKNISLHCDCLPRWHLSPQKEVKLFVKEISRMPQIRFPSMTFWWPGTPYCLTQWGNFTLHLAQFLGGKFKYLSSHFIGPIVLSVTVSIYFSKKLKQ